MIQVAILLALLIGADADQPEPPPTVPLVEIDQVARMGAFAAISTDGAMSPGVAYCGMRFRGPLTGRTWCGDILVSEGADLEVGIGLSVSLWKPDEQAPKWQGYLGLGALAPYREADEPEWRLMIYVSVRR